jgi:hypothetical protein
MTVLDVTNILPLHQARLSSFSARAKSIFKQPHITHEIITKGQYMEDKNQMNASCQLLRFKRHQEAL